MRAFTEVDELLVKITVHNCFIFVQMFYQSGDISIAEYEQFM